METVFVEIRAAEGGADAKLLVYEQAKLYQRWARRTGVEEDIVEDRPGFLLLRMTGPGLLPLLDNEPGGHRWQRVPPTERRGRTHTSTVTVAVLHPGQRSSYGLLEKDLVWRVTKGSGAGGQKRDKTSSAIQLLHVPSGTSVRVESERSQHRNRQTALELLSARLQDATDGAAEKELRDTRRAQVGTGQRGDKVRTIALQRGVVTDHRSGRTLGAEEYLRGGLERLWARA